MQSALIVTIPEAEDAVAQHRARFDDAARFGIPAHVTVIFPFMPPSQVNREVIDTLAAAISTVPTFQATFESTGWFGTNVLWLAPNPAAVFGALITAAADAFPDYPPFERRHEVVVPHLTVGHADAAESGPPRGRRASAETPTDYSGHHRSRHVVRHRRAGWMASHDGLPPRLTASRHRPLMPLSGSIERSAPGRESTRPDPARIATWRVSSVRSSRGNSQASRSTKMSTRSRSWICASLDGLASPMCSFYLVSTQRLWIG